MIGQAMSEEALIERLAGNCSRFLNTVGEVFDTEVASRMGYRSMLAVTLPAAALAQEVLPKWRILGDAPLPLLWCAVLYYVIRFRTLRALEAAVVGSLLAWLAYRGSFMSSAAVLFVSVAMLGCLGRWLFTEFCPAHAVASGLLVLMGPVAAWVIGARSPVQGIVPLLSLLVISPLVSVLVFYAFEWLRGRLGISIEPADEKRHPETDEMIHRPHPAVGPSF